MESKSNIYGNVLDAIGNTPIVELHRSLPKTAHRFFAKLEFFNPGSSVKDRIAFSIVEAAEKSGELKPGGTIVEATSGNTGVGLGLVAAVKGYKCIFVMPEKMSEEKRATLKAYGAQLILTPNGVEPDDPRSHYSVAKKIAKETPGAYLANQYHNVANASQHYKTTGPEIWQQMGGDIDVFVAGAGTGGTISGVGKYLREKNPNIRIVCADPIGSILYDVFYHKKIVDPVTPYLVEGIGEDMLPDNVHFDVMTDFVKVNDKDSFTACRNLCRMEGMMVGPSAGSAMTGALQFSQTLKKPAKILVLLPDSGKSYLSKVFDDNWMRANKLID